MLSERRFGWAAFTAPEKPTEEPAAHLDDHGLSTGAPPEVSGDALAPALETRALSLWYGRQPILERVSIPIADRAITALVGPESAGKSSLLRCLNRMTDLVEGARREGDVRFRGQSVLGSSTDVHELRRRVGWISSTPNPFAMSIFDNVCFGPRLHGERRISELERIAETALRRVDLWGELASHLHRSASELSRGVQQRLCIARSLAVGCEALLLDEPCAALDPLEARALETVLLRLRSTHALVLVTHDLRQVARVSDYTALLSQGRLIEIERTHGFFLNPRSREAQAFISGDVR